MKESRFIELLNLYVDQQLTAPEAAELEAELQNNPASRRTYRQYCRMQKACTQLYEQECQGAPSTSTLSRAMAKADRKVVAFPERRSAWRQRGVFAAGLAAMAACVAFVLVRQTPVPAAAPAASNQETAAVVAVAEPVVPSQAVQTVSIPPADPQTKDMRSSFTVFPVRQFVPVQVVFPDGGAVNQIAEQPNFSWMNNVELAPMRPVNVEAQLAETSNADRQPTRLYISNRRSVQTPDENNALSFQK